VLQDFLIVSRPLADAGSRRQNGGGQKAFGEGGARR
jgi:hypothetical protein